MKPTVKQKIKLIPKQSLTVYSDKRIVEKIPIEKAVGHNRKWSGILFAEMLLIPFFYGGLSMHIIPIEIIVLFIIYIIGIAYTLYQLRTAFNYSPTNNFESITFTPKQIINEYDNRFGLEAPYLFELFVTLKKGKTYLKLNSWQRNVIDFELSDIQDLAKFTDGLSKLYKVDFFDSKQSDFKTEKMTFLSKNGFHYNKLILIQDEKNLKLTFFDFPLKVMTFSWSEKTLFIDNQTDNFRESVDISEIQEIKVKMSRINTIQKRYINTFSVQLFLKSFKAYNIAFFDLEDNLMTLSVFKTAVTFMNVLKSKPELNYVNMEIEGY
jgi:hypothetical protein